MLLWQFQVIDLLQRPANFGFQAIKNLSAEFRVVNVHRAHGAMTVILDE